ncbi:MAG: hypothetical protein ABI222_04370 [Opitutaceae bacterium]
MKHSPEDLEKLIHQTLRALPPRRAPLSLEVRVHAALAARAALPWWQQSFPQWPVAARVAFILASAGMAKLAIMGLVWGLGGFDAQPFTNAIATQWAWLQTASAVVNGIENFCGTLFRSIPPLWLYGGLAVVASLYAALFGLGAAVYRTLYANRS